MPTRNAEAEWEGSLNDGTGTMRFGSGAFEGRYSFSSRFEEGPGTNPEELIAAAHAGCFSMNLSGVLGGAGYTPERVRTTADVHLRKDGDGFTIAAVDLHAEAEVPGLDDEEFQRLADEAERTCPVSRLLTGATINLDAKLV
ncbi:MAG: OsmC family protein [Actinomycetota bacterium]|nr:OsmC family protein [Actinomycetota bacterium]